MRPFTITCSSPDCHGGKLVIQLAKYGNERLAVRLAVLDTGEPYATLSVNLPNRPEPAKGQFYAKFWGDNEYLIGPVMQSGHFKLVAKGEDYVLLQVSEELIGYID